MRDVGRATLAAFAALAAAAGMHTVLVITGSATREQAERFPYRPQRIIESIADLIPDIA